MKPIRLSRHALQRSVLRGAEVRDVEDCIRSSPSLPAELGKRLARKTFLFSSISPVNGKFYDYKTIEAIFVEDENEIVVVTVKVFYSNGEQIQ